MWNFSTLLWNISAEMKLLWR